ncbi:MAG: hypothetical protein K6T83_16530 [Alicyclobacillus sp.]|nr:hypothetical protein [Alicyclobacillus sp.]
MESRAWVSSIAAASVVLGSIAVSPIAWAGSVPGMYPTQIEVNGHVVSSAEHRIAVDPLSHEETSWLPIWYLESVWKSLGIQSTWNGRVWSMETPSTWKTDIKWMAQSKTRTSAEMEIAIDGKEVEIAPRLVAKDPWGNVETIYVPVYYVEEALKMMDVQAGWNGRTFVMTTSSAIGDSNPQSTSEKTYPSVGAAADEIARLVRENWEVDSTNPPVTITNGVKAEFVSGAGQYAYKWNEGHWTIITRFFGNPATTQRVLQDLADSIKNKQTSMAQYPGLIVITQSGTSTHSFRMLAVWQDQNRIWTFQSNGDPLRALTNLYELTVN